MEEQDKLKIGIGDKEIEKLEAVEVEVQGARVDEVMKDNKKIGEKVVLLCKHPKKDELLNFSQVRYLRNDKVSTSGLWFNKDDDGKIQKGSALAITLSFYNVPTVGEIIGKKVNTDRDSNGYLCVKAF